MAAKSEPLLAGESGSYSQDALKYGSLTVMLLGYSVEQVLMKRASSAAYYPTALTTLTAFLGLMVYPVIILGAVQSGRVKLSQVKCPLESLWKPLAIGCAFCIHHLFLNVAAGKKTVPGIWTLVLGKSIVPMSMVFNMLPSTMGLRYDMIHWLAMLLLLGGVVLTLIKDLSAEHFDLAEGILNIIMIVVAQLPLAAAFTFMEVNLKGSMKEMFTVALWFYICIFQAICSLVTSPVSRALAGKHEKSSSSLADGVFCYTLGRTPADAVAGTDCTTASIAWWITIFGSLAMNLAMPISTRYGGAALMWFVRALSIPITGFLFASSFMMGANAKTLNIWQVLGLAVVAGAVLLFNSKEPSKPQESNKVSKSGGTLL